MHPPDAAYTRVHVTRIVSNEEQNASINPQFSLWRSAAGPAAARRLAKSLIPNAAFGPAAAGPAAARRLAKSLIPNAAFGPAAAGPAAARRLAKTLIPNAAFGPAAAGPSRRSAAGPAAARRLAKTLIPNAAFGPAAAGPAASPQPVALRRHSSPMRHSGLLRLAQPQRVALRRHSSPMRHSGLLRLGQPRSAIMRIAEHKQAQRAAGGSRVRAKDDFAFSLDVGADHPLRSAACPEGHLAELRANAQVKQAAGEAEAVRLRAHGSDAEAIKATGQAEAEAYRAGDSSDAYTNERRGRQGLGAFSAGLLALVLPCPNSSNAGGKPRPPRLTLLPGCRWTKWAASILITGQAGVPRSGLAGLPEAQALLRQRQRRPRPQSRRD